MKLFIAVATLLCIGVLLIWSGFLRTNYPHGEKLSIHGIDISHHQGDINWSHINTKKYQFVYMKATEGGDFVDPRFMENWRKADSKPMRRGAYHFYRLNKTGVAQAHNFINTVPVDSNALPPVIDLEIFEKYPTGKTKTQIRKEIKNCMNLLHKTYNKKPVIYTTYQFYNAYLKGYFPDHVLWIRDIWKKPSIPHHWQFWQYSNRGHVRGIEGFVDLNVFHGTTVEFNAL